MSAPSISCRLRLTAVLFASALPVVLAALLAWLATSSDRPTRWRAWSRGADFLSSEGVFMQRAKNDCAPAVLLNMLRLLRIDISEDDVYRAFALSEHGASMQALREVADGFGVKLEGWRLSYSELAERPLPAILLFDGKHFVVAKRFIGARLEVLDPALGRLTYSRRMTRRHWRGHALILRDDDRATSALSPSSIRSDHTRAERRLK